MSMPIVLLGLPSENFLLNFHVLLSVTRASFWFFLLSFDLL